jgi:hypothetical protein
MFFQQIGGSLGVAAFGALFASKLNSYLSSAGASGFHAHGGSFDPAQVTSLPAGQREVIFHAITHGVQSVFMFGIPASVVIFLFALLIKEIPLRGRTPDAEKPAASEPELIS